MVTINRMSPVGDADGELVEPQWISPSFQSINIMIGSSEFPDPAGRIPFIGCIVKPVRVMLIGLIDKITDGLLHPVATTSHGLALLVRNAVATVVDTAHIEAEKKIGIDVPNPFLHAPHITGRYQVIHSRKLSIKANAIPPESTRGFD